MIHDWLIIYLDIRHKSYKATANLGDLRFTMWGACEGAGTSAYIASLGLHLKRNRLYCIGPNHKLRLSGQPIQLTACHMLRCFMCPFLISQKDWRVFRNQSSPVLNAVQLFLLPWHGGGVLQGTGFSWAGLASCTFSLSPRKKMEQDLGLKFDLLFSSEIDPTLRCWCTKHYECSSICIWACACFPTQAEATKATKV